MFNLVLGDSHSGDIRTIGPFDSIGVTYDLVRDSDDNTILRWDKYKHCWLDEFDQAWTDWDVLALNNNGPTQ